MAKTFVFIAYSFFFAAGYAFAQSVPNVNDFTVDGIRVILRHSPNQVVALGVVFKGGYAYGETDNPYLAEATAALTTSSGSARYAKEQYRAQKERLVTTIWGNGNFYDTDYWLRCVKQNFDKSWDMFADVILHPLYDTIELRNEQANEINDINNRRSSPDRYAYFRGDSIWRSSNPRFGRITEIPDVRNASVEDMRKFHDAMMQRARMYVVVVGNVTREEITQKLAAFSSLPEGAIGAALDCRVAPPAQSALFVDPRENIPTTYIYGFTAAPDRTSPEYWTARLTASYLRERFFQEVRTKRNLSYAPFAFIAGGMHDYRFVLGVSSILPDSAIGVMLHEIEKVQRGDIDAKMFNDEKNVYLTYFYQRQMTNLSQAQELYSALRETGDWREAFTAGKVQSVKPAEAQQFAAQYLHHVLYSIAGQQAKITDSRFLFN